MNIRTFSGTHAFDSTVLADTDAAEQGTAEAIIENIERGRCPRCEGPLPTGGELSAGSRITRCRSIPICGRCGSDESLEIIDELTGKGCGLSSAGCWPIPVDEIDEGRARYLGQAQPAILTGEGQLISGKGCTPLIFPCNTGGWAQYGTRNES